MAQQMQELRRKILVNEEIFHLIAMEEKEERSFLKKEPKNFYLSDPRVGRYAANAQEKKFFGSFFQKRTNSFTSSFISFHARQA
jgi:Tfp pilus assembly ATPase PilU